MLSSFERIVGLVAAPLPDFGLVTGIPNEFCPLAIKPRVIPGRT